MVVAEFATDCDVSLCGVVIAPAFSMELLCTTDIHPLCRVQLNLLVCSPFGEYEVDLDIQSFSDEGSTLEQRTSWQVKNGPDEVLTGETNKTPWFSLVYTFWGWF